MTKKRLSDLLREEVQKDEETPAMASDQPSDNFTIDVDSTEVVEDEPEAAAPEADTETADVAAHRARSHRTTKAELSDRVTALESELESTQQREATLQQQARDLQADLQEQQVLVRQLTAKLDPANQRITALQTELDKQKGLVQRLQGELEQANQLEAELAEAKQLILKLSEENTALKAPPQSGRLAKAYVPPARPIGPAKSPFPQPTSVPELEDNQSARPVDPSKYQPGLKKIRRQSIQTSSPPPSMLSNDDIGWVD